MLGKIVTVTLNPAIDETITLDALVPGHVNRANNVTHHAGGKGINVASCLADWGNPNLAITGFLGAENASIFEALCAEKTIADAMLRIPGATRTNIKLVHDGDTTDINVPGLAPEPEDLQTLAAALQDLAREAAILLLAGSLPPGVPENFYANTIADLKPSGARIILDTRGAPLAAALRGDVMPYCIKPNRAELEEYFGASLPTQPDIIAAAKTLRAQNIALVVVSMGAEGALFIGDTILHAKLPAIRAASTVGAGDAMVAGLIAALAGNADAETTARLATAFAAGKLSCPGPNLPPHETINELAASVEITILEEPKK